MPVLPSLSPTRYTPPVRHTNLVTLSNTVRYFLIAFAALSITACGTAPVRDDAEPEVEERTLPAVELIPLEDEGMESTFDIETMPEDLSAAIRNSLREADESAPPRRQSAYLDAVENLVLAGRLDDAQLVLDRTDVEGLSGALNIRKRLLQADIHFHRGDLDRAYRDATRVLRAGNVDPSWVARGLDIKARIDLRRDRPLDAAQAWSRRDNYLSRPQALAANHQRIWYALGRLDPLELQAAVQQAADDDLRGWLDLAILFLEFGSDRDALRTAVDRWRQANGFHPAAQFSQTVLGPPRTQNIRQLALLLPLSSRFGSAARQVYDGFDAAHGTDSHPRRPQVVFYDIGGEPALVGNYVGAAEAEGADVIVGPLGKDAVNALLELRRPEKPMLLLGSASGEDALAAGYEFDLAPEPEAGQVAEFMYASGHRRVAALYPDGEWGERIYQAFIDRWRDLGGELAEAQRYQPGSNDFTGPIKNLFNLSESETRESLLESASGLNLNLDPRRRQDIDAVFMAARPDAARLLKPQINFFQGHDLPVYSTSDVYSGEADAASDKDLDGIRFPHMPWVMRESTRMTNLRSALGDAGYQNTSGELFAFGYDAYRLALVASDPALAGQARLEGLTGGLVLGRDGRIHRRFDWAQFSDGVPVRIWRD